MKAREARKKMLLDNTVSFFVTRWSCSDRASNEVGVQERHEHLECLISNLLWTIRRRHDLQNTEFTTYASFKLYCRNVE
jgi:hypothetical protein